VPPVNNSIFFMSAVTQFRTDIFQKALDTKLIQLDVEQIVPVILARAGAEKRQIESGRAGKAHQLQLRLFHLIASSPGEDAFVTLITVLESGIEMVHRGIRHFEPYFAGSFSFSISDRGSPIQTREISYRDCRSCLHPCILAGLT
jgi:hypothetical protein